MTDSKAIGLFFVLVAARIGGARLLWWWSAQPSRRPKEMPANSIWIAAPAVPIAAGSHRGWWFGCQIGPDNSNRCKLWDGQRGSLEYEGSFVACPNRTSVRSPELKLRSQADPVRLWVSSESGHHLVPVAVLENGTYLVPEDADRGCEELQRQLESRE